MPDRNRQILLVETPKGKLGPEHFRLVEAPLSKPQEGEVLARVRYISLDAANRAWMQGATYRSAVEAGSVMAGGALAEIVESKSPALRPGDLVFADTGWQEYAVLPAKRAAKLPRLAPLTHLLSVYGIAGLTAYFGLLEVGQPKPGETVVVSAAAGSVGSFVGQIAKIKGCRAVGIAGGAAKCDWLVNELGFDAAVDYKAGDLAKSLKAAAPNGIDVFFDNVGGEALEAALARLARGARVVLCGAVSQYNATTAPRGPANYMQLLVARASMTGFVIFDYAHRYTEGVAQLAKWLGSGELRSREQIIRGDVSDFPEILLALFRGENTGKLVLALDG